MHQVPSSKLTILRDMFTLFLCEKKTRLCENLKSVGWQEKNWTEAVSTY